VEVEAGLAAEQVYGARAPLDDALEIPCNLAGLHLYAQTGVETRRCLDAEPASKVAPTQVHHVAGKEWQFLGVAYVSLEAPGLIPQTARRSLAGESIDAAPFLAQMA
jgi:hypothetical protein